MTINEIKKEMTDAFIANEAIKTAYNLIDGKTFDDQFSKVSIESIFFYIVATSMFALQFLFEQFKEHVEDRIRAAIPGTVPWYHNLVKKWVYNDQHPIAFCSVTEPFPWLHIKVNTEGNGILGASDSPPMIALRSYIDKNKFAGTQIKLTSDLPEILTIAMRVWISAAEYNADGSRLDTGDKAIEMAIRNYLENIVYDGTFFKSRLVDAVQAVSGVHDVELISVHANNNLIMQPTYRAQYGAFEANFIDNLNNETLIYVLN